MSVALVISALSHEESTAPPGLDQGVGHWHRHETIFPRDRLEKTTAENPGDLAARHGLARVYAFLGRREEAIRFAEQAIEQFDLLDRAFVQQDVRSTHAEILCQAGAFDAAEEQFRQTLSSANEWTLASLLANWPPCKAVFEQTGNNRRLERDFGHLSDGLTRH